jgi:hypothetical protein
MDPFQPGPGLACLAIFGLGGLVAIILITAVENLNKPSKK